MDASRFIAGRLRFNGLIATVAIAVSFLVMILAVTISSGFRHSVRDGVASVAGDIRIAAIGTDPLSGDGSVPSRLSVGEKILSVPGVRSISPAVFRAGIVKNGEVIHGVLLKGVPGRDTSSALGVSIPARLGSIAGLAPGDGMTVYFIGEKVRARKFHVDGFSQVRFEVDKNLVVEAGIDDMRRLNGWDEGRASVLEVSVDDAFRTKAALEEIAGRIGTILMLEGTEEEQGLLASSAVNTYPQLFDWLDLLDFNVVFLLVLMTLVAGFNMISGLLILLFRNISTIGILKTMGMTDRSISKVFLRASSNLVLKGMAIGNAVGLLFCLVQGTTHLIRLNPENYFVPYVPVHVNIPGIIAADVAAYAVIMLLLLIPSLFISTVDPAKTVRVH